MLSDLLNLELPRLSDEELAFLDDGRTGEPLVDLTTLDALDEDGWELAVSNGLRSLLDRRLLSTADEPEQPLRLRAELEVVLAGRSQPSLVVLLQRVSSERQAGYAVYGVDPGVVLIETVVQPGVHDFRLCASALAACSLAAFADPGGAARTGGDAFNTREALEAAIGVPDTLTRVFAVRDSDDDRPSEWEATIAASETGLWVVVDCLDGSVSGWPIAPAECADLFERLLDPDR